MTIADIVYKKDLIIELLKKELKVRYKNSFLGYLWSVAMPLSLAIIYYYAFKFIMRINIEDYALFLIIGLFPWQWFANSIISSANIFVANASLIKKTTFSKETLIYATVLNDLIHYLLSVPVILAFMVIYRVKISYATTIYLPLIILLQFLVTAGFSLFVSSINVFFRDLERLTLVFINLLFYLTPIIYDQSMIPSQYKRWLMYLNPVFPLMELYRGTLLKGKIEGPYIFVCLCQSLIVFISGYYVFNRLKWKFPEVL